MVPKQIEQAPQLILGLDLYFDAFAELSSCRSIGMAEGPIPWTAIRAWCDENEVVGEQREKTFRIVRAMDVAYLKWRSKKDK